jgi:GAF domain-containing protein
MTRSSEDLADFLCQLTGRAPDVLAAPERLRGRLSANGRVLDAPSRLVVLRHIVTAARDLAHARYAALGVVGVDGLLDEFVHVGMDVGAAHQIGALPSGRGILGLMNSCSDPVRLTDLTAHPAATAFPAHHPPMRSFLGVAIRVRDQVVGGLHLTESAHGEFSTQDALLVAALAATAGVAIDRHPELGDARLALDG